MNPIREALDREIESLQLPSETRESLKKSLSVFFLTNRQKAEKIRREIEALLPANRREEILRLAKTIRARTLMVIYFWLLAFFMVPAIVLGAYLAFTGQR